MKFLNKLFSLITILATLLLSSCSILKELKSGMNEAFVLVENFCLALEDSIDSAKEYLHLDSTPQKEELLFYVTDIELRNNFDFSDGVTFKRRIAISSAYYDSAYDGSVHEVTYQVIVGIVMVDLFFTVFDNDKGYGIYNFGIE